MGMAASQARYLALVARKTNCEYEGQQINQSRTALSNQSANLFNQMLGLTVPVPPSTQDYTKTQYSFKSGDTAYTLDSWKQLSSADPDYNYIVDYHYNANIYTGSEKKLGNPQVQMSNAGSGQPIADLDTIRLAQLAKEKAEEEYETALNAYNDKVNEAKVLTNYSSNSYFKQINGTKYQSSATETIPSNTYTFNYIPNGESSGTSTTTQYSGISSKNSDETYVMGATELTQIVKLLKELSKNGAIEDKDLSSIESKITSDIDVARSLLATNYPTVYYDTTNQAIAFSSDLNNLNGIKSGGDTSLKVYSDNTTVTGTGDNKTTEEKSTKYASDIIDLEHTMQTKLQNKNDKTEEYNNLVKPAYIGNCPVTLLTELTDEQKAEIRQIVVDMKANNITTNIANCYEPDTETYKGGIYSFEMNGQTYYTTYTDLCNAYPATYGNNNIDCQTTLPYYNATYVNQQINTTSKALIQTGSSGVFQSVKFENDSVVYTLSMETITDDAAYNDAMNEYYYQNAKYDKTIQDINAKTSLIQQEDQQLELKMKQLETEQQALKTEIDAVKGIIKDNIDSTFKTFSS